MRDLEHIEGAALMRWAELNRHVYPELKWLFHIPNGGARGVRVGGKYRPPTAKDYQIEMERQ